MSEQFAIDGNALLDQVQRTAATLRDVAWKNPQSAYDLALMIERDVALARGNFAHIQRLMSEARNGEMDDESSEETLLQSLIRRTLRGDSPSSQPDNDQAINQPSQEVREVVVVQEFMRIMNETIAAHDSRKQKDIPPE